MRRQTTIFNFSTIVAPDKCQTTARAVFKVILSHKSMEWAPRVFRQADAATRLRCRTKWQNPSTVQHTCIVKGFELQLRLRGTCGFVYNCRPLLIDCEAATPLSRTPNCASQDITKHGNNNNDDYIKMIIVIIVVPPKILPNQSEGGELEWSVVCKWWKILRRRKTGKYSVQLYIV